MAVLHLGIKLALNTLVLRGTFVGGARSVEELRNSVISAAKSVRRGRVYDELESLAAAHHFVVELAPIRDEELIFYFWELEPQGEATTTAE